MQIESTQEPAVITCAPPVDLAIASGSVLATKLFDLIPRIAQARRSSSRLTAEPIESSLVLSGTPRLPQEHSYLRSWSMSTPTCLLRQLGLPRMTGCIELPPRKPHEVLHRVCLLLLRRDGMLIVKVETDRHLWRRAVKKAHLCY